MVNHALCWCCWHSQYMGLVADCVCSRTLIVSKGWPTSVTEMPPQVPANTSFASFCHPVLALALVVVLVVAGVDREGRAGAGDAMLARRSGRQRLRKAWSALVGR